MAYLLIDNVRNISSAVKNKKISPEEGKEKVNKALTDFKSRKVIRDYLSEGMRAKHFSNTILAIGEVRSSSSRFLYAFNDFNDVFPTLEMGYKFEYRMKLTVLIFQCIFVGFFTCLFYMLSQLPISANDYLGKISIFLIATTVLLFAYEKIKKMIKKILRNKENAKIKSLAKELDIMLVELTCINKYTPRPGETGGHLCC